MSLDFDPPIPKQPDKFPIVRNAHIVPRHYLDRFADEERQIQVVLVKDGHSFRNSTRNVAIRDEFYGRTRPDGSRIFDTEWSISILEGAAAELLRRIADNWPLGWQEKATLAQFFGLQLVRGPKHFEWRERVLRKGIKQAERGEMKFAHGVPNQEEIDATAEHMLSESARQLDMQLLTAKVSVAFGSMTWALVRFDRPLLALGDHPVTIWPIGSDLRRPRTTDLGTIGLRNLYEVRIPVSPQHALLMFWGDRVDEPEFLQGQKRHAKNLNSFSIGYSELEWFFNPESPRPPASKSRAWRSLSSELLPNYSHADAFHSKIRERVGESLQSEIGKGLDALDEHGRYVSELIVVQDDEGSKE